MSRQQFQLLVQDLASGRMDEINEMHAFVQHHVQPGWTHCFVCMISILCVCMEINELLTACSSLYFETESNLPNYNRLSKASCGHRMQMQSSLAPACHSRLYSCNKLRVAYELPGVMLYLADISQDPNRTTTQEDPCTPPLLPPPLETSEAGGNELVRA